MSEKLSYRRASEEIAWLCDGIIAVIASIGGTLFGIASFQVGKRRDRINSNTASKKNSAARVAQPFVRADVRDISGCLA